MAFPAPTMDKTFRPAATNALERANMPSTCECCGREKLKRTVKMVSHDGTTLWMGVGCAAKGTGVPVRDINKAEREAQAEHDRAEWKAREVAWRAESTRWQAHLDARCPELAGRRFEQIRALGGMAAASVGYAPAAPASLH